MVKPQNGFGRKLSLNGAATTFIFMGLKVKNEKKNCIHTSFGLGIRIFHAKHDENW